MEKAKQVGSPSSSFTVDLFGPKDDSNSSTGLFGSIFGPPNTVPGKDNSRFSFGPLYGTAKHGTKDNIAHKRNGAMKKEKNNSSNYENTKVEPCYYNSSIYYGGQEVYSPTTKNTGPQHLAKKDRGDADPNDSNSNCASRGNWWQGSLYY